MRMLALIGRQSHRFVDATVVTQDSPNPLLNDWAVDLAQMEAALTSSG